LNRCELTISENQSPPQRKGGGGCACGEGGTFLSSLDRGKRKARIDCGAKETCPSSPEEGGGEREKGNKRVLDEGAVLSNQQRGRNQCLNSLGEKKGKITLSG